MDSSACCAKRCGVASWALRILSSLQAFDYRRTIAWYPDTQTGSIGRHVRMPSSPPGHGNANANAYDMSISSPSPSSSSFDRTQVPHAASGDRSYTHEDEVSQRKGERRRAC